MGMVESCAAHTNFRLTFNNNELFTPSKLKTKKLLSVAAQGVKRVVVHVRLDVPSVQEKVEQQHYRAGVVVVVVVFFSFTTIVVIAIIAAAASIFCSRGGGGGETAQTVQRLLGDDLLHAEFFAHAF
jgi:hypothetical protein